MGYTVFHVCRAVTLWELRGKAIYFWAYWICDVFSIFLGFFLIYEIYSNVLKDYAAIHKLGKLLFEWAALILICFAILSAATASPSYDQRIVAGMLSLERSASIVQCGLVLFLFSFASFLKLNWKDYVLGIAVGLGISLSTELAIVVLRAYYGSISDIAYTVLKPISYNCAVMVWFVYLLLPRREVSSVNLPATNLADWNRALSELLAR